MEVIWVIKIKFTRYEKSLRNFERKQIVLFVKIYIHRKIHDRLVKTLLAWHVSLGVFNNSRENKQCRLIENPDQNNVGETSSRIAKRVANRSGIIA
jgi:hypothetical protein